MIFRPLVMRLASLLPAPASTGRAILCDIAQHVSSAGRLPLNYPFCVASARTRFNRSPSSRHSFVCVLQHSFSSIPSAASNDVGPIEEIDYDPSLTNTVTIMGNVGRQPEVRYFESGNKVARWSIAYRSSREAETQWLDIEAWGSLGEKIASEIQQGQQVVVQGRLKIQTWTDREGQNRRTTTIVANSIKRVRPYRDNLDPRNASMISESSGQPSGLSITPSMQYSSETGAGYSPSAMATTEELWMSFFEDTSAWYDNRPRKTAGEINPRAPDFKKKEGGRDAPALWIDSRSTPAWVLSELARLDRSSQDLPPF